MKPVPLIAALAAMLWTLPALAATAEQLVAAALERTRHKVVYDPAYRTDEVVRAYRALGIDLQRLVHEDMKASFRSYPRNWGLTKPDHNIDHRRVPNLQVFFTRHGKSLPVSKNPVDYAPGDLVTWDLGGNIPHIGIVTDRRSPDDVRPMIVHNIGAGPKLEDMLFEYRITGHYRYL